MKRLSIVLLLSAAAGCGDNFTPGVFTPDAQPDSSPDAMNPFVWPSPFKVGMASAGPDVLMSVAPGPNGSFYAAGYAAQTVADAKYLVVVKLTATGSLDTSFATSGIYTSTIEFKGGSDEIDVVAQSSGNVIVAATIANDVNALDKDVGLFRLDTTGALDATFGVAGFSRINLTTAYDNTGTPVAPDGSRGLAVGPSDTLFLHANARGDTRQDTDFTVARLTANGLLDLTYGGTDGFFQLDIQNSASTARGLHVLADGTVIAGGYANSPGLGTTQPVLYRLTPAGALDTNFATGGLFHETVLSLQTEVYNFGIDGNHITTAGYGRDTGTTNDWVTLRFDLATGARDLTFGGAPNGAPTFDPSGAMLGSNCRNAVALPGGRTALIGSTGPSNMPAQEAVVAILKPNGTLDTDYGTGVNAFKLGTDGNDQFWGGAVSNGKLMVVGWQGGGMTQTATTNDDAHGIVMSMD